MRKSVLVILLCLIIILTLGCLSNTSSKKIDTEEGVAATSKVEVQTLEKFINPIDLISVQDAEKLIGEPMMEAEITQNDAVGQISAFYESVDSDSDRFLQISITQQATLPKGSDSTPETLYKSIKAAMDETVDVELNDIGDDCFTGIPGLHILSNGCYITIGAGNTSSDITWIILNEAGTLAIENLDKIK